MSEVEFRLVPPPEPGCHCEAFDYRGCPIHDVTTWEIAHVATDRSELSSAELQQAEDDHGGVTWNPPHTEEPTL